MDFRLVATVVLAVGCLALVMLANSKVLGGSDEKTLSDIIQSAREGREDFLTFTPQLDLDLCVQVGGELGCDEELGVEPRCFLFMEQTYLITASPTEAGVCLRVEEVS